MELTGRYRIPLSCHECSRRKIRCDRKFPCRACRERGQDSQCYPRNQPRLRARNVPLDGPATGSETAAGIDGEMAVVQSRLSRIESMLGIKSPTLNHSHHDKGTDFKETGLAGAMEEAALGLVQKQRWHEEGFLEENDQRNSQTSPWFASLSLSECLATLPFQDQAFGLLEFFCDYLNPIFGHLSRDTLFKHHNLFWSLHKDGKDEDSMAVALLFAVLSVSAYFLNDHLADALNLQLHGFETLAARWFNCSLATFFRCGGLTRPSLLSCQTILVLHPAFNFSGNTPIHRSLMQVLLGSGRSINLHLLGEGSSGTQALARERDLGRRVWWQIVEGEWHFLPYQRFTSVIPSHFDTDLPNILDDGSLASEADDVHSLSVLITCCRTARIIYDLYGNLTPTEHPAYESVLHCSERLSHVCKTLPDELKDSIGLPTPDHPFSYTTRRYLSMMLAYRSYLIHRAFFAKSLGDKTFQESRRACIHAAEEVLACVNRGMPQAFLRLWSTAIWMVSAGIVLSLDLIYTHREHISHSDALIQREKLSNLIRLLSTVNDRSGIGIRGAKLISYLCRIEEQMTPDSPFPSFSRQDILRLSQSSSEDNNNKYSNLGSGQAHERRPQSHGQRQTLEASAGNGPYGSIYGNLETHDFGSTVGGINMMQSTEDFLGADDTEMIGWDLTQFDLIFGNIPGNI